ncbi:MAG: twin-arginine translocation pathway signal protein [Candidatus Competibacteraceae bacterium]|nr:twin-arginine translocation pathway signal protein [Candidatus Competibacteraceae bacterium]
MTTKPILQPTSINLHRRQILRSGALGAFGVFALAHPLAARVANAALGDTSTVEVTEGPYFVDELLNRSDIRYNTSDNTYQDGLPLLLTIHVLTLDTSTGETTPLKGAYVDIWHCNAAGLYSDVSASQQGTDTTGQDFLRGYQVTKRRGRVRFRTIYPGWYQPRAPHIHCKIRQFSGNDTTLEFTTQFAFDDEISNTIYTTVSPYTQRGVSPVGNDDDQVFTGSNSCIADEDAGDDLQLALAGGSPFMTARFNVLIDLDARCTSTEIGGGAGRPGF